MTATALDRTMAEHNHQMAQITTRSIAALIADDCVKALDGDWRDLPNPVLVRRYAEAVAAEAEALDALREVPA